jgi:hypothetical protein
LVPDSQFARVRALLGHCRQPQKDYELSNPVLRNAKIGVLASCCRIAASAILRHVNGTA